MADERLIQNVAILGASDDRGRFSHQAFMLLKRMGYNPLPISNSTKSVEGVKTFAHITDIPIPFHTLTMYVRRSISSQIQDEILAARPDRVIFNPGTENPLLEHALRSQGTHVVNACTLVLLQAGEFDKA
ncbi:MAG: CoA-binding protein [Bdellovibrio sp.]|nr:CoA-binding protein [Bdellovibrio sp.]